MNDAVRGTGLKPSARIADNGSTHGDCGLRIFLSQLSAYDRGTQKLSVRRVCNC